METKTINYTITFLSDWHTGSGLSSGANADAIVIKDKNNLPYIPGKTIKGLLKDALLDIYDVQPSKLNKSLFDTLFGSFEGKVSNASSLFFSNVELVEKDEISTELSDFLYRNVASTTINENGVAKDGSLRTMEVTIPITLEGYIGKETELSAEEIDLLELAMKWTRSLGSNRNRGLGRCLIELKK
jgi:CRISPR/Cas system CSM-associated protein Csm3 (group 7 of RAMP superfamily)